MVRLTPNSKLKTPNHTQVAEIEGKLVVSSVSGTKTLSGAHADLSREIISASDGTTELRQIPSGRDEEKVAIAEILCNDGLAYRSGLLDSLQLNEYQRSLFEDVVLSADAGDREALVERVRAESIWFTGNRTVTERIRRDAESIGLDVVTEHEDADIIVFCESGGDLVEKREDVNRKWIESESVLVRAALDGLTFEVGPILTPSAQACLECLTTRESINDSRPDLAYETVVTEPTYDIALLNHYLLRLIVQTAAEMLPSNISGRIVHVNGSTLEQQQSVLLGVPGCEICESIY